MILPAGVGRQHGFGPADPGFSGVHLRAVRGETMDDNTTMREGLLHDDSLMILRFGLRGGKTTGSTPLARSIRSKPCTNFSSRSWRRYRLSKRKPSKAALSQIFVCRALEISRPCQWGSVRTDATRGRLVCGTTQSGVTLSLSGSSVGRTAPDEWLVAA
jgi:hypothetical protein